MPVHQYPAPQSAFSTRAIVARVLGEALDDKGVLVFREERLPVCSKALDAVSCHAPSARMRVEEQVGEVAADLLVVRPDERHAVAVVVGGRSSEGSAVETRRACRGLLAAELTLVEHLRARRLPVDVALVAVLVIGETTTYPDEIVVRANEIDALFEVDVAGRLVSELRAAARARPMVHHPRIVGCARRARRIRRIGERSVLRVDARSATRAW